MEKIYIVTSTTSDDVSTMVCDTPAEAKTGFITFFESNPNADIKILEFSRKSFYQNIAENFRLSAYLNEGVVINPFTFS